MERRIREVKDEEMEEEMGGGDGLGLVLELGGGDVGGNGGETGGGEGEKQRWR